MPRSVARTALLLVSSLACALALAPLASAAHSKPGLKCTITGTSKADSIVGTSKRDVICAGGGNDTIDAGAGDDVVFADHGEDTIKGGPGADRLHGGPGNDSIDGGAGDDQIYGQSGKDRLGGGDGTDVLFGDVGNDTMDAGDAKGDQAVGGPGRNTGDTFVKGGTQPFCPSDERSCRFYVHFDTIFPCPDFQGSLGSCVGKASGDSAPWTASITDFSKLTWAAFGWTRRGSEPAVVTFQVLLFGTQVSLLTGTSPAPGSAVFNVDLASALGWAHPSIKFYTPQPTRLQPLDTGGPLYMNFDGGRVGADVYIYGILLRR